MKNLKPLAAALLSIALLGASGIAAAQASGQINAAVEVTFSPKCQIATAGAEDVTVDFGAVDAFQATDATNSQTAIFECTRGYSSSPTFTWDGGSAGATVQGSVKGLRYSLAASSTLTTPGEAPSLVAPLTAGTPDAYTITIDGTLFSGAGDNSASNTSSHTLVFSF